MHDHTILVVEDDDRLRRFILSSLAKAGYGTCEAASGKAALVELRERLIDLVLLDLRLGDMSGMEILKTIRRQDDMLPVIIVSSIGDLAVKLDGLATGCDDYITKPFYVEELLLRVGRILARTKNRQMGSAIVSAPIASGPFVLDMTTMSVMKNGVPIAMRKKLLDLFLFFIRHPDVVLPIETLYGRAWDSNEGMNENSLYVHIRELRKLIEDDPSKPRYITTARNFGYVFSVKG